ncbi:UNVERIFIED_CONTAM: hypothetical protein RMT77_015363 [Armadillidium vulgare]
MIYDGVNSLCSRPFYDLISNTVSCNDNDLNSYIENSNLYAYDLTPDLSASNSYHLNIVRKGTLGLSLTFGKALTSSISVIVYLEHPKIIEIDGVRNIILNY